MKKKEENNSADKAIQCPVKGIKTYQPEAENGDVIDYYSVVIGSGIFPGPSLSDGEAAIKKFLDDVVEFNKEKKAEIARVCYPKNHHAVTR